ncbi:MAG: polysaccharide deacetylase family protein [Rhodomicrobium sp.]|nr:polysaccharide deacetylase family protein [Rhodomicrobium sp.]
MKPLCSLSLDLDNLWSYMRVHGDEGWAKFPSYLDVFVPRFLDFCAERDVKMTVFIVGQDAAIEENHRWLRMIAEAGHEICNHSFRHEPWLHNYSPDEIAEELSAAENAIEAATGVMPRGFRGPGFSFSREVLERLAARGYDYDASTFPTFIGPLARAYYFATAKLSKEERSERSHLFGSVRDVFRPNTPFYWTLDNGPLLEVPVTTIPLIRSPFHFSYLIFLAEKSPALARLYLRLAILLCRVTRTEPSMLLHPLDFLGPEDAAELQFFPGMKTGAATKTRWLGDFLDQFNEHFTLVAMGEHVRQIKRRGRLLALAPSR